MEIDEVCVCLSPPLWLWTAVSRETRLFLGFVIGGRSDAALERLLEEELHWAWRDLPACIDGWQAYGRLLPADLHEACSKQSGKTSIVEARKRACSRSTPRYASAVGDGL